MAGGARSRWGQPLLKIAGGALAGVVLIAIVAGAAIYLLLAPTMKVLPRPAFPPPKSQAEANRQDLAYLRRFTEVNRSFTPATQAAFLAEVEALDRKADTLDPGALEMGASRAVALADDAHTNVRGAGFGLSTNALPIRLEWFQEGMFVVQTDPADKDLLGARVVSEAGRDPQALEIALRPFIGGPESFRREHSPHFMISPQALEGAGLTPLTDRVDFVFDLRHGERVTRTIVAAPGPANGPPVSDQTGSIQRENHWPRRDLSPVRAPNDPRPWAHLLDGQTLPLYLTRPNDFFWRTYLPQTGALYLQINATRSVPNGANLAAFLKTVVEEVKARRTHDAIVDLRFNPGGNGNLPIAFTKALPAALPKDGRIFIVTSGNTLSAGIITTARLKYFGGARADIVGERMGDREQFWAEGQKMVLPNSKVEFHNTAAWHDWKNGCSIRQISYCYLFLYQWGVPAGDLSPTLAAPISFADYMAGEDTVMKAIAPILKPSTKAI
jgi:hypothetical protein